jgi:squalene-associated FAD-dependent desaturase
MRRLQGRAGVPVDDCSVATLLDRHGQHGRLRRHLWEALCLAALNTAPAQASARIFAHTLRDSLGGDRAATDLLLPTVDLGRLFPEAAAGFITLRGGEIRLGRRVAAIEAADRGLAIHGERFDAVVLAVAPQHAGALLARHPRSAADARLLAGYAFEPIGTVYCGYPPEVRLPFPMLGLGANGDGALGQWVFDRGALCGTAGVLAFVLSGSGRWQTLDNPRLADTLHRELASALRRHLPPFVWSQVIRERRATFSCRPGLPRPQAASARAGLWLAGDYVCADYPATLEAAVRSGVAAARGILGAGETAGA